MAQASQQQRSKATTKAAFAVICVILFSTLFAGGMYWLTGPAFQEPAGEDDIAIEGDVLTEPFYVLLIGSDTRRGTALYTGQEHEGTYASYADILTLMRIDPLTYTITLVSVPRDTVKTPYGEKVNASLLSNDPQVVVDAVGDITGVDADFYMLTTFISFENLVNAIGGVTLDVPKTITVDDPSTGKKLTLKAGKQQHLNGTQALALARARHEYGEDQEAKRQMNVRAIEAQILRTVLDMDGGMDIDHVLATLQHDTYTNMDLMAVGPTIVDFVAHADQVTIYQGSGLYKGHLRSSDGDWVVVSDDETWYQLMSAVDAGADPSTIIKLPKF